MMEAFLVPERTVVNAKGDGPALDVSRSQGRIFLLTLAITNIIEQESLDVGIFGSADGTAWDAKPIIAFPQKFYREEVPLLLNLTTRREVKFVRAHWEVARWGRGSETPMFEFNVVLREVPQEILAEAAGRVRTQ
ncbi:MAG TPA: hypothetical protein VIH78_17910 [Terriglobales bacterium]